MRKIFLFLALLFTVSCSNRTDIAQHWRPDVVATAGSMLGMNEQNNRWELRTLLGVDPVRTEWCAAFVNMVLEMNKIPGSDSVSNNPLMARSFMNWGTAVSKENIKRGDIVVFPRGRQGWQGHVGFYVETMYIDGVEYYAILGGNQEDNSVSLNLYPAKRALAIRREPVIRV